MTHLDEAVVLATLAALGDETRHLADDFGRQVLRKRGEIVFKKVHRRQKASPLCSSKELQKIFGLHYFALQRHSNSFEVKIYYHEVVSLLEP